MAADDKIRTRIDPEMRKAQILEHAIRIVGERGFYGFTLQDLAKSCGLTAGGLLYHFKTKEDLFVAVVAEYERRMGLGLAAVGEHFGNESAEASPRIKALALLRSMVEQSAAEPELMRLFAVVQVEALHQAHPAHDYFAQLQHRIMAGLGRIVEGLTTEPEATAREIYALMVGLEYQWLRTEGTFDYPAAWDRAVAKLLPEDASEGGR